MRVQMENMSAAPHAFSLFVMDEKKTDIIWGRHPVLEALRSDRSVQRLLIADGVRGEVVDEIFTLARQAKVPYDVRNRDFLDRIAGPRHQGVIAYMAARSYADFETVLADLDLSSGFLVFLDQIQDPHNLGAIVRSAYAVGADAVVLPRRGACGLTATAVKAAAGAAEHVTVCQVDNIQKALQKVRSLGVWTVGLDAQGNTDFTAVDYGKACALVVGSEGRGLRRMVGERCDFLVSIPMARSEVGSLNASVAAGIVLYEVHRQRCA